MRAVFTVLAFAAAFCFASAEAQPFEASQCERIQNVEAPYDITVAAQAITFSNRSGAIVVTSDSIHANGRTYANPAVATYYQDLTAFLSAASSTARAMNPLGHHGGMGEAATNMCHAILDLAASTATIESEFNGYSSPVRIRLR